MRMIWGIAALGLALTGCVTEVLAGPALLVDAGSGRVFYAEDPDQPWHPASTTKLMTAYLTFEALKAGRLKLDDAVLQSERSIKEPPSKIGLSVGLGMSVELALQSLIIKSANDVAVMLAEKVGGSVEHFVEMMNAKARKLGLNGTHFVNPNGLHNVNQVTTARDLAKLALAILRDFPEHKERFSTYYMKIGKRRLHSYNTLLKNYEGADGMKTGFVCASGYNVVASATRNGHKLLAVVLGERNLKEREARAAKLLTYGFEYYDWKMTLKDKAGAIPIDQLPIGPYANSEPGDMRSTVCSGRPAVRAKSGKKIVSKSKRALKSKNKRKK